jgi:hypothetical protein
LFLPSGEMAQGTRANIMIDGTPNSSRLLPNQPPKGAQGRRQGRQNNLPGLEMPVSTSKHSPRALSNPCTGVGGRGALVNGNRSHPADFAVLQLPPMCSKNRKSANPNPLGKTQKSNRSYLHTRVPSVPLWQNRKAKKSRNNDDRLKTTIRSQRPNHSCRVMDHSWRKATTGSTRMARRAGM